MRLRLSLGVLVGIAMLGVAYTACNRVAYDGPALADSGQALLIDSELHDFGVVSIDNRNGTLRHTFVMKNQTDDTISLTLLTKGCGCLAAQVPTVAKPHCSTDVPVEIDVQNREGLFETQLTIGTSAPSQANIVLKLRFFGEPDFNIKPAQLWFTGVSKGELLKSNFQVVTRVTEGEEIANPPEISSRHAAIDCTFVDSVASGVPLAAHSSLRRVVHRFNFTVDTTKILGEVTSDVFRTSFEVRPNGGQAVKTVPIEIHFQYHPFLAGGEALTLQKGEPRNAKLWTRDKTPCEITAVTHSDGLKVSYSNEMLSMHSLSIESDQEFAGLSGWVQVTTDRWPNNPYRISILLLP